MILERAKIGEQRHFIKEGTEDFYLLTLIAPNIAREAKPGQFVMIKASYTLDPFLRRPFSIFFCEGEKIVLLYKVVGKGTNLMSNWRGGEKVSVLGPLGRGFQIMAECPQWLVAGGTGIAPLYFLGAELAKKGIGVQFIWGLRYKVAQGLLDLLNEKLGSLVIYTEDGSMGDQGLVTSGVEALYEKQKPAGIYACGPWPMLKALAFWAKKENIPMQVSLETQMACGIGACLGCIVEGKDGYKKLCQQGPVFKAEEIKWER